MERPESRMVRKALAGGAMALPLVTVLALALGGPGAAISSAIGVALVVGNFALHGWSLAWAAGISISAVQAVALGGFALRMGLIVAAMFALRATAFFVPLAFGLSVVAGTIALLVLEARLYLRLRGSGLEIPADPIALEASERLREREEALR